MVVTERALHTLLGVIPYAFQADMILPPSIKRTWSHWNFFPESFSNQEQETGNKRTLYYCCYYDYFLLLLFAVTTTTTTRGKETIPRKNGKDNGTGNREEKALEGKNAVVKMVVVVVLI